MGTIVVTTDLSDAARLALPLAKRLAEALELPLVILHVVHAPVLAPAFAGSFELDRRDAERALATLAAGLGGQVTTRVVEVEEVGQGIVDAATDLEAELLVTASHGRTGLARLQLGSVVEQVLELATLPVVCVPATGERAGHGARVIAASDLSIGATAAFPVARRLADALSLPLTLLVVEDPRDPGAKKDLQAQAAQLGGGDASRVATELVQSPDTAEGIVAQAKLEDAAFVCTAARHRSTLRRLLLGSVSRKVVRSASFPVVVVPPGG